MLSCWICRWENVMVNINLWMPVGIGRHGLGIKWFSLWQEEQNRTLSLSVNPQAKEKNAQEQQNSMRKIGPITYPEGSHSRWRRISRKFPGISKKLLYRAVLFIDLTDDNIILGLPKHLRRVSTDNLAAGKVQEWWDRNLKPIFQNTSLPRWGTTTP